MLGIQHKRRRRNSLLLLNSVNAYRIYQLNAANRIYAAQWIEAPDDAAALALAGDHCELGIRSVEVWQGRRLVGRVDCFENSPA